MAQLEIKEKEASTVIGEQIITFTIGKELFGTRISLIKEIVRFSEVTRIPRAPTYLSGLINLRGHILPVIDSRIRLKMKVSDTSDASRILIIDLYNNQIGVIVDSVRGVIPFEDIVLEKTPDVLSTGVDSKYIKNIIRYKNGNSIIMELSMETLCEIDPNSISLNRPESMVTEVIVENRSEIMDEIQLVTFTIGEEEYGFPIESVREILRIDKITEVPDTDNYIIGLFAVRDLLLPIVDLRTLFGLESLREKLGADIDILLSIQQDWRDQLKADVENRQGFLGLLDEKESEFIHFLDTLRTSSEEIGSEVQKLKFILLELYREAFIINKKIQLKEFEESETLLDKIEYSFNQLELTSDKLKHAINNFLSIDQRILVIEIGSVLVGFMVDRMQQVIRVSKDIIENAPSILSTERSENLKGIAKLEDGNRLILLLDQNTVFNKNVMQLLMDMNQTKGDTILEEKKDINNVSVSNIRQLVTFKMDNVEYAVDIESVQEINRFDKVTPVPRAPSFIEGVMNLRGSVIPAIDLRKRFDLDIVKHTESTRIMIVSIANTLVGLIVDSVNEVLRMEKRIIEKPPSVLKGDENTEYISGIGKLDNGERIIIIIDTQKIFSGEETDELLETEKIIHGEEEVVVEKTITEPPSVLEDEKKLVGEKKISKGKLLKKSR